MKTMGLKLCGSALARWLAGAALAFVCSAGASAQALPTWQELVFEQSRYGFTARSSLALQADPQRECTWLLHVESSVASNRERVELTLRADSAALLERQRFSAGRNQRLKQHVFSDGKILRERREPGADAAARPADWPLSSARDIAYPAALASRDVTDSYALLLLATRLAAGESSTATVLTDFNFYQVTLQATPGPELAVDYSEQPGGETRRGKRATLAVALQVSALGEPEEARDFSLLGLEDEIIIYVDAENGLPLRLTGQAPRVGSAGIDLRQVTSRTSGQ
ncbi:hypothetical protein E4634_18250 [Mangrovimicrobium sediminis]|uniref:DUF3108 domain-containing protein n=1 Tax=Mangrovimicrobium sediminis TaxID=2562682 RepID=A0A4Z0LW11_9GAMM|nr:hypothetical protein [Haliea sp. SAOS-164]TGD71583.1 hypothetical protein E4634_18250 [Haliea sp. SAOS-164]